MAGNKNSNKYEELPGGRRSRASEHITTVDEDIIDVSSENDSDAGSEEGLLTKKTWVDTYFDYLLPAGWRPDWMSKTDEEKKKTWDKRGKWFGISNASLMGGFFLSVEALATAAAANEAMMIALWITELGAWRSKVNAHKLIESTDKHIGEARWELAKAWAFFIGVTLVVGALITATNLGRLAALGVAGGAILGGAALVVAAAPIVFTILCGAAAVYHFAQMVRYGFKWAYAEDKVKRAEYGEKALDHAKGFLVMGASLAAVVGGLLTGTLPIMLPVAGAIVAMHAADKASGNKISSTLWGGVKKLFRAVWGKTEHVSEEQEGLLRTDRADSKVSVSLSDDDTTNPVQTRVSRQSQLIGHSTTLSGEDSQNSQSKGHSTTLSGQFNLYAGALLGAARNNSQSVLSFRAPTERSVRIDDADTDDDVDNISQPSSSRQSSSDVRLFQEIRKGSDSHQEEPNSAFKLGNSGQEN